MIGRVFVKIFQEMYRYCQRKVPFICYHGNVAEFMKSLAWVQIETPDAKRWFEVRVSLLNAL